MLQLGLTNDSSAHSERGAMQQDGINITQLMQFCCKHLGSA